MNLLQNQRTDVSTMRPGEIHLWTGLPMEHGSRALALRCIGAQCIGRPIGQMRLKRLPSGKPAFDGDVPCFSLAHTNNKALATFAGFSVGVDVESVDRAVSVDAVARRYLHQLEYQALVAYPELDRRLVFLRLWVRKEAVVKMTGEGIALGFGKVLVDLTESSLPAYRNGEPVFVKEFTPWRGAVGAIAAEQPFTVTLSREYLI